MSFDLDGLAEQLQNADSATPQDSSPSPEVSTPTTQETSPVEVTPQTVDTEPQDDVIEVTFKDGTKETIKRSELPNYVLRQQDYTRKSQQLAEVRKKYEKLEQNAPFIREQLEFAQQMRQATQDPQALFRYVVEQLGPENAIKAFTGLVQQNPAAYDPNDIPTYGDADKIINDRLKPYEQRFTELEQRFQQRLEERLQEARLQERLEAQQADYETRFSKLINEQLDEHKALKAVKRMPDILRYETAMKIQQFMAENGSEPTFEQAATWIKEEVQDQLKQLQSEFAAARAASPLNNGIEPAGGNRQVTLNTERKSHYNRKTGELDSDSLLNDLAAQLQGIDRL